MLVFLFAALLVIQYKKIAGRIFVTRYFGIFAEVAKLAE